MRVIEKGEGEPEIAVVTCVHGDEECGRKAVEKLLQSHPDFKKPVKFIVANEKAIEQGERFIETDLNRCFPGDPRSNKHEERVAAQLLEELRGCRCLTIHSMENFEGMFCLVHGLSRDLAKSTGLTRVVDVEPLDEESLEKYVKSVSVETGEKGSSEAVQNSLQVIKNFLRFSGVLSGDPEMQNLEVFEMLEAVEKPDFKFLAENFQEVEEGEVYARDECEKLEAKRAFYPVLMGESYEKILGFKGRKVKE